MAATGYRFGYGSMLFLLVSWMLTATQAWASEVQIYNWLQYLPKEILEDFQRETGIRPRYVEFESRLAMENKLLTGNSGYDVAFPGSTSLRKLIIANAVQPLRRDALSNWQYLDGAFMKSLEESGDPRNRYAVPYLWGATLFGYDADKLDALFAGNVPASWDLLFKPENARKLAGCGIGIIDAPDEILPIALNYLGLDPNGHERSDYRAAQQLMQRLRPAVRYFDSERYGADLANGTICFGVGWSGGFVQARQMAASAGRKVRLNMVVPKEGSPYWSDVMVVPSKAPNPAEAHAFINYILRPDVIARISLQLGYPAPSVMPPHKSTADDPRGQLMQAAEQQRFFTITPVPESVERIRARVWRNMQSHQGSAE
ncbi:extracellular solute-binding protein [Pseudomonas sp. GOM7]|uniref:extracellular solute-binding protein n=1 Tax=Pseudomonas sp. GOM7 TaxID=2998079 RepID=UPI00227A71A5|nr:extracellular solute-binding protein [Pseudomonas sp. GOM7]WAJ39663.1 extracellular solute-binding protein [Pseudomonas sp. GOM7]